MSGRFYAVILGLPPYLVLKNVKRDPELRQEDGVSAVSSLAYGLSLPDGASIHDSSISCADTASTASLPKAL